MLRLFFNLGRAPVLVRFANQDLLEQARAWFLPAVSKEQESVVPLAELRVDASGVEIVSGPVVEFARTTSPIGQLERVFLNWGGDLSGPALVLHSGCIVWQGRPLFFIAPSGSGKSTMTLAAVKRGATYITDDTAHVGADYISGFARAIRFDFVRAERTPELPYLQEMDLETIRFKMNGEDYITPIYPESVTTARSVPIDPACPPVVVTVARGPDHVRPLSDLERVIALHECAIVRHGEYDGSLGPGPSFALTWTDPERAFAVLQTELARLK